MKKIFFIIVACFLFFLGEINAQNGSPFYSVETEAVCWTTGGIDSTIWVTKTSFLGTSQPTRLFYHDAFMQPVTGVTDSLQIGRCNDLNSLATHEADLSHGLGYFLFPDTIQANTVESVTIQVMGTTTHDITVDGIVLRLYPGESYHFTEWYNRKENRWEYNPEIIIPTGNSSKNNTRVIKQLKN